MASSPTSTVFQTSKKDELMMQDVYHQVLFCVVAEWFRVAYLECKDQRNQSFSSLIWVWPFDQFLVNVNRLVAIKRDLCDCVEQIGNPTSPVWKNLSQVWKI